MTVCKCCGHPIPPSDIATLLPPIQRRMFNRVLKAGTHGIETRDLFEHICADDIDGGPLNPNIVAVMARHIRKRIAPHGLTIRGSMGHGSRYFITPITPTEATHALA